MRPVLLSILTAVTAVVVIACLFAINPMPVDHPWTPPFAIRAPRDMHDSLAMLCGELLKRDSATNRQTFEIYCRDVSIEQ